ncbi:hypothetical protein CDAR_236271 [Caerostris darwini]|uniref:Uncharacterized protein n=1 Tax=Caerostris darwini TaxID=1538125 RepID=A0AAV4T7J3_9ARAC|nr:hypothetical protein CDAR_236271 [Caerostris darwini]
MNSISDLFHAHQQNGRHEIGKVERTERKKNSGTTPLSVKYRLHSPEATAIPDRRKRGGREVCRKSLKHTAAMHEYTMHRKCHPLKRGRGTEKIFQGVE